MKTATLAERMTTAIENCGDVESLAGQVFAVLRDAVPFDFACLATMDPADGLITRAVKSHPLPMGDEEFFAAEYGEPDINQFAEIVQRPVPVAVLSVDTGGQVERCRRLRDYMTPAFGFTDEVRVACRAQGTVWGGFALYRTKSNNNFTGDDAELLAAIQEVVAGGLRRVLFAGSKVSEPGAPAVLIVDAADTVTDLTAAAEEQIAELGGWYSGSLPAGLAAVAAQARATGRPARTRARGLSGRWLSLQALPLQGGGSVVMTIDSAAAAAIGKLALAARGLTAREQDIAGLVLQGASTKDIASSLFLSPHTVQDHLKAVFRKLGVSSRREMIAQLVTDDF